MLVNPQSHFDQHCVLASTATSQVWRQTASSKGVHGRWRQVMGTRMTRSAMTVVLCRKHTLKHTNSVLALTAIQRWPYSFFVTRD